MTGKPKVAVTRRLPGPVEERLASLFDCHFNRADTGPTSSELQLMLGEFDGILATITDRFTAEVFTAHPIRTRIIANFGVGFDNIDVNAASVHSIAVTNTPGVLTDDTADLAMTLILMAMRRAGEGERELRSGRWSGWRPTHLLGKRVSGTTLGVVGLGRIGKAVARRASAGFGMKVQGWGRTMPSATELSNIGTVPASSLDQLLATSDVVSLHLPGGNETTDFISTRQIALMPPGSVLVNTARGSMVNTDALVDALISGHLSAAGFDVYPAEPKVDSRLLGIERVVLLPHLGSATNEGRVAMGLMALSNLQECFAGKVPTNLVTG